MQKYVASSSKAVIFTAHSKTALNDKAMVMETRVPIKGSLANQGKTMPTTAEMLYVNFA